MGPLDNKYYYEYDDPYKVLAHYIVGFYRPADVLKILTENVYLKNCIIREVRDIDMGGHFVDCIIENILEDKDRMEYMHELDKLASYFYSRLDKARLRDEIITALNDAGISLGVD